MYHSLRLIFDYIRNGPLFSDHPPTNVKVVKAFRIMQVCQLERACVFSSSSLRDYRTYLSFHLIHESQLHV